MCHIIFINKKIQNHIIQCILNGSKAKYETLHEYTPNSHLKNFDHVWKVFLSQKPNYKNIIRELFGYWHIISIL